MYIIKRKKDFLFSWQFDTKTFVAQKQFVVAFVETGSFKSAAEINRIFSLILNT